MFSADVRPASEEKRMWIHNGVMYFCAVDAGNPKELSEMEYSKRRCSDDFVKPSGCIEIFRSLSE